MYLIFHLTSQDHVTKGSYDSIGASSLRYITILTSLVTIGIVIREISICRVTSRDHVLKGPCEVMDGSLFALFMVNITLSKLVIISTVLVNIYFSIFHMREQCDLIIRSPLK